MFVLYPDGQPSDSATHESQLKTNVKFFGKLGLYFLAIRIAHVFLAAGTSTASGDKSRGSDQL